MKAILVQRRDDGTRTFMLAFDKGDEAKELLARFARHEKLGTCLVTGIGAFSSATLGYFDRTTMDYAKIPVDDQVEVLSFVGDIAEHEHEPEVHVHVVLGRRDGSTCGGHLLAAYVWPALEVVVAETPEHLRREIDDETGLALLQARE